MTTYASVIKASIERSQPKVGDSVFGVSDGSFWGYIRSDEGNCWRLYPSRRIVKKRTYNETWRNESCSPDMEMPWDKEFTDTGERRFLLFGSEAYYPSGGVRDLLGAFSTVEKAIEFMELKGKIYQGEYQIFSLDTFKVVEYFTVKEFVVTLNDFIDVGKVYGVD